MTGVVLLRRNMFLSLICCFSILLCHSDNAFAQQRTFEHELFRMEVPRRWRVTVEEADHVRWEYGLETAPLAVDIFISRHVDSIEDRRRVNQELDVSQQSDEEPLGHRQIGTDELVQTEYGCRTGTEEVALFENHRIVSYRDRTLMIKSNPFTSEVKQALDSLELRNEDGEWLNIAEELLPAIERDETANLEIYRTRPAVQEGTDVRTYNYLAIDRRRRRAYLVFASEVPGVGDVLEFRDPLGPFELSLPKRGHARAIADWIAGPNADSLARLRVGDSRGPYIVLSNNDGGIHNLQDCMWIDGQLSVAWYASQVNIGTQLYTTTYDRVQ